MIRKSPYNKRFLGRFSAQSALATLLFFSPAFPDFSKQQSELRQTDHTSINLKSQDSGEFSVLTYNIAGLPQIISSAATRRAPSIAEIGRRLNNFDIVNVQEDFNYNRQLYHSGNAHPFRTRTKGGVPFGDGLNTLSRFPVHQVRHVPWNNCTGADCLTPKGFTFSRIEIADKLFIHLYNIHANAYNHLSAAGARRENLIQLSKFIRENSKDQAVIIMGDFNAHYSYHYDNVHQFLKENEFNDAWLELKNKNHIPAADKKLPESNILKITGEAESIDKIFYRSNELIQFTVSEYHLENFSFLDNGKPLSDHHPVSARFSWKLQHKKGADLLAVAP
ncbi:endonuclease/exonuclease/phosphatase family protein [Dyadobacter sp. CY312]|uniref:endonuclease/exonuclease/phosphatase family protein n=1 Tax=Dyadobacter sp. CY312 TaxID=2907303 RepID=UPI001F225469|nr:endonuclease/exonuclease/phosphatase family protein [Dyadobacter sp. CY312]MCE7043158.1 endonuclease/exonuclease/phosphatase family protein [Dyadobacter sp. CY312]